MAARALALATVTAVPWGQAEALPAALP